MLEQVNQMIAQHGNDRSKLLEILGGLQQGRNHLLREELVAVAEALNLTPAEVYGTATFYSLYSTKPRGKYVIRCCENAPCHIEGAAAVLEAIRHLLDLDIGETTNDLQFTLETTSCLGVCSAAPSVMINERVYGGLTPEGIVQIINDLP